MVAVLPMDCVDLVHCYYYYCCCGCCCCYDHLNQIVCFFFYEAASQIAVPTPVNKKIERVFFKKTVYFFFLWLQPCCWFVNTIHISTVLQLLVLPTHYVCPRRTTRIRFTFQFNRNCNACLVDQIFNQSLATLTSPLGARHKGKCVHCIGINTTRTVRNTDFFAGGILTWRHLRANLLLCQIRAPCTCTHWRCTCC